MSSCQENPQLQKISPISSGQESQAQQKKSLVLQMYLQSTQDLSQITINNLLDRGRSFVKEYPKAQIVLLLHRYKKPNLLKMLSNTEISHLQKINLKKNTIFGYEPLFKNLITLNLGGNFISNIQPLTFIDLPVLKTLFICMSRSILVENNCISLRPLSKASFRSLSYFNFPEGKVKQLKGIERCNIPNFMEIYAYDNQINFFCELFKLQSLKMKTILIGDQFQSVQFSKSAKALGRKYNKFSFF